MFDTPTVLVVDDEPVICRACRRILSRAGFHVHVSRDAPMGLDRAKGEDYSAILLDVRMPEMDGFRFLEELRKQKRDVPVIIITGYGSAGDAASAVRRGASDYLTKPFTPEQILRSVRNTLALRTNGRGGAGL